MTTNTPKYDLFEDAARLQQQAIDVILASENENGEDRSSDMGEIEWALMDSMDAGSLNKVRCALDNDEDVHYNLTRKIDRVLSRSPKQVVRVGRNRDINVVLKEFSNRKSHKVVDSRKELQKRFDYQSYSCQKRILSAMFQSPCKSDHIWACRKLKGDWDNTFVEDVMATWLLTNNSKVGRVVIKYLPPQWLLGQIDSLVKAGVSKAMICMRLYNEPGFPWKISPEFLDAPDYLYVLVKLGRNITQEESWSCVAKYILGQISDILSRYSIKEIDETIIPDFMEFQINAHGILSFEGMGIILWALGKLGHTSVLCRLYRLAQETAKFRDIGMYDYFQAVGETLYSFDGIFSQFKMPNELSGHPDSEDYENLPF